MSDPEGATLAAWFKSYESVFIEDAKKRKAQIAVEKIGKPVPSIISEYSQII